MERLKRRADFLATATGNKVPSGPFVLQARLREEEGGPARVGFTVTKKVGNAVVRNRIRRRLRELVRLSNDTIQVGHDYVLIGRRNALNAPFDKMADELKRAVGRASQKKRVVS